MPQRQLSLVPSPWRRFSRVAMRWAEKWVTREGRGDGRKINENKRSSKRWKWFTRGIYRRVCGQTQNVNRELKTKLKLIHPPPLQSSSPFIYRVPPCHHSGPPSPPVCRLPLCPSCCYSPCPSLHLFAHTPEGSSGCSTCGNSGSGGSRNRVYLEEAVFHGVGRICAGVRPW